MGDSDTRWLDVQAHLGNANYPRAVLYARVLWALVRGPLHLLPRQAWGLRNAVLRRMGARIGHGVKIYPNARIRFPWTLDIGDNVLIAWDVQLYSLGPITIGDDCIVSQGAHLCAGSHDHRQPNLPLTRDPITIGPQTWICAEAFIGPGVTVGRGNVVAARAVVVKDTPDYAIVGGNPARVIKQRAEEHAAT